MTEMDGRPEVLLFTVDAGGGHRAAAHALVAAAEATGWPCRFRLVNLQSVLAPLDLLRSLFGLPSEDFYNLLLRRRFTALLLPLLRLLQLLIVLRRRALVEAVRSFLASSRPAAVVSVVPNFNGVIRDAVRAAWPGTPFLVLLTDFADLPPGFWIEPGIDRAIVGTDRAVLQARALGLRDDQIARVSGMVLHPRFYAAGGSEARRRVRLELGIPDQAFAVLLLFGGKGSAEVLALARSLVDTWPEGHVVALCGDNPPLLEAVSGLSLGAGGRLHTMGFTDRVADYMAAADLLVTKPGPGSLSEAFQEGLPVVVADARDTIPMERFNVRFVEEKDLGLVVPRWQDVPEAVARLASDPARLSCWRLNLQSLPANRAVYEVLDIVAEAAVPTAAGALTAGR
jgi:processive 1,2-diacylglycerol beta-glucosyltransferase